MPNNFTWNTKFKSIIIVDGELFSNEYNIKIHITPHTANLKEQTEYFERLKGQGIKGVVITGLYADICVLETAQSLLDEGFQVMVVEDLVDTNLEETRAEGMQKLKDSGARMVSETQVMDALGHGQLNELHRGSFTIEESTQRNAGNTKSAQCISYLRL